MSRVIRRNVVTACLLTAVFALLATPNMSARQYSGGTWLTGTTFCLSSDNGVYQLCHHQNSGSGWKVVNWNSPSLNSNCSPYGIWDTENDTNCIESGAQGSHSNQSADATSSAYLRVQSDGNVVLYQDSSTNYPVWSTNTSGYSGATLELLNRGYLDVNYFGSSVWSIR